MYNPLTYDMLAKYKLEELRKEAALIRNQKLSGRQRKVFKVITLMNTFKTYKRERA